MPKVSKRSRDYWRSRFTQLEKSTHEYSQSVYNEIEPAFTQAQMEIQKEIDAWYARFAANNGVSLTDAKRMLTAGELSELKWDVNQYIKYGRENAVNGKWVKELENASAKFHITRLEAIKLRTQQALEKAFGNQLDNVDKMAHKILTDNYYHSIFEVQKGFNIGWRVGQIDQRQLDKLVVKPWAADGKNFSDRIWQQKQQAVSQLHNELTRMLIQGKSPDEAVKAMTKFVDKNVKNAKSAAYRLVQTESAYFQSVSQKEAFNDLDVEQYEILATIDLHTSEICQEMDGKRFPMKDYEAGVTAPPFHPNCRSTTVPYDPDFGDIGERAARDKDGKTYYIPANMTYPEWKAKYVDGNDPTSAPTSTPAPTPTNLTTVSESGTIKENVVNNSRVEMSQGSLIEQRPRQKEMLDVTDEYIKSATPEKGIMARDVGYDESKHKDEIKSAEWLYNTFGGDIVLLKEANIRKIKTPDYLWNNKLWELKDISSINSADQQLRCAIKQIQNNPGGVLLNLKANLNIEDLLEQLNRRAMRSDIQEFDLILLMADKLIKVLRYKK